MFIPTLKTQLTRRLAYIRLCYEISCLRSHLVMLKKSLEDPLLYIDLWHQSMLQHTTYPLGVSFFSPGLFSVRAPCRVTEKYVQSTEAEDSLWHISECTSRSSVLSDLLPPQNPWLPAITKAENLIAIVLTNNLSDSILYEKFIPQLQN